MTPLLQVPMIAVVSGLLGAQTTMAEPKRPHSHPAAPVTESTAVTTIVSGAGWKVVRGPKPVPLARVREAADGSVLYSRSINRILCSATDPAGQRTWLGTPLGLKCIDPEKAIVQHFSEADGLPSGAAVAVAAETNGDIWCVVQSRTTGPVVSAAARFRGATVLSLCRLPNGSGAWQMIRAIHPTPAPPIQERPFFGGYHVVRKSVDRPPRIAIGSSGVVVSLGTLGDGDSAALYYWNRRTNVTQQIEWEQGLRFDNHSLAVDFLAFDPTSDRLWLGTNAGLLQTSADPQRTWRRLLPETTVVSGVAAPGGGVLVVTKPRKQEVRVGTGTEPLSWKLYEVAPDTTVRDLTPDIGIAVNRNGPRSSGPLPPPNTAIPTAVSWDRQGCLWLTQLGRGNVPTSSMQPALDAWWKRDAKGNWTRYELYPPRLAGIGQSDDPPLLGAAVRREESEIVSETALPDAAVLPLALHPPLGRDYSETTVLNGSESEAFEDARAGFWINRRFSQWICRDAPPPEVEEPDRWYAQDGGSIPPSAPDGTIPKRWILDLPGSTLLRLPETAIPEDLRQARSVSLSIATTRATPIEAPGVERFPLPAGQTVSLRPRIEYLVASGDNSARLYLVTGSNALLSYDTKNGTYTRVPVPKFSTSPSYSNPPVVTPDGGILLANSSGSENGTHRFTPVNASFEVTTLPGPDERVIGITAKGGIWKVLKNRLVFVEADGTADSAPATREVRSGQRFFMTGFIGWTIDGNRVSGYDFEKRRPTAALEGIVPQRSGSGSAPPGFIRDERGGVFTAGSWMDNTAAAYHYNRDKNTWQPVAPPFPFIAPAAETTLVAANPEEFWFFVGRRSLIRYDRRSRQWGGQIAIPSVLHTEPDSDFGPWAVGINNENAIFVGGAAGLWRFDPKSEAWTECRQEFKIPTPLENAPVADTRIFLSSMASGGDLLVTVWNANHSTSTIAMRLEPATGKWTVYDESRGFPERGYISQLVADGHGAWLIHETGTYFLDTKSDKWRLIFEAAPPRPSRMGVRIPPIAKTPDTVTDPTLQIQQLAIDPQSGDTFLLGSRKIGNQGAGPLVFRFDAQGKLRRRTEAPAPSNPAFSGNAYSLLRDGKSVLVGTDAGIFRIADSGDGTWEKVDAPAGLRGPSRIVRLQRSANRPGLYVMNANTVVYWAPARSASR